MAAIPGETTKRREDVIINMATTQQVNQPPNPTGKGGFGDHPENRNPGGWRKEVSFSYQYKRFMAMTIDELAEWMKKPMGEKTVVEELAHKAVARAKNSLADVKEITDRTEGKAPQFIGVGDKHDFEAAFQDLTAEELRKLAK